MGEYAIRKSDNVEVKIGTCEEMFYLRFEDRDKVRQKSGSLNPAKETGLYFRLPFPEEDDVRIGEYKDHTKGYRLYKMIQSPKMGQYAVDFELQGMKPGLIQLTHKSGLLLNVSCYHGEKLPKETEEMRAFWNGKSWSMELSSVKLANDGYLYPIVHCRHCGTAYRVEWSDIAEYIHGEMKEKLNQYIEYNEQRKAVA